MSREDRRRSLLEATDRLGLGAVVMGLSANFAWYTGGADSRVDHSQPLGVAAVVVLAEVEPPPVTVAGFRLPPETM